MSLPRQRRRLEIECDAQSRLVHKNIVRVYKTVEVGRQYGLLMDFVRGPSLDQWTKSEEPDLAEKLEIFRGVLAAVRHAHSHGLIHRDIKPQNVLMARVGRHWIPKLTDFGLVLDTNEQDRMTKTGSMMGTPRYMSPEQIRNTKGVDRRADFFSLGSLLYELMTGVYAFDGVDQFTVMATVVEGTYRDPRLVDPSLPENVCDAIDRLLTVDRDERLHSIEDLERLLYADGDRKKAVRRSALVVGTTMLLTALAGGIWLAM